MGKVRAGRSQCFFGIVSDIVDFVVDLLPFCAALGPGWYSLAIRSSAEWLLSKRGEFSRGADAPADFIF